MVRPDLAPDRMTTSLRRQKIVVDKKELPYWDGLTKQKVTMGVLKRTVDDTASICQMALWQGITKEELDHALIVAKLDASKYSKLCGGKIKESVQDVLITCLPNKDGSANCFVMPATGQFLQQFAPEKPKNVMVEHRKALKKEVMADNYDFGTESKREQWLAHRYESAPSHLRLHAEVQAPQVTTVVLKDIPRIEI